MSPLPGKPVRGSATGRPIMALLDLLGRRWCLRILWELRDTTLTFRALQTACGDISPTVMQQRLKDLREARLVEHREGGYRLTPRAARLQPVLLSLQDWSEDWVKALEEQQ